MPTPVSRHSRHGWKHVRESPYIPSWDGMRGMKCTCLRHVCSGPLTPLLPMPCMGGTPVVMSSLRTDLPGSSMVVHSLGFFPGIVRWVDVIHGPGAYPVDLHNRFLFGPGKMGGLGLHNGHAPGG